MANIFISGISAGIGKALALHAGDAGAGRIRMQF